MKEQMKDKKQSGRYTNTTLTHEDAGELRKDKAWNWICENRYGTVYWNENTGELMWVSDDDVKYQRLSRGKKKVAQITSST